MLHTRSTHTPTLRLLPVPLILLIALAAPARSEDCSGAFMTDDVAGGVGTYLEIGYLDAQAGGVGGQLTFTIPHTSAVDEVRITSIDGLDLTAAATGTQTQVTINTQGDGSPSNSGFYVGYSVVLLISGVPGNACYLEVEWAQPSCELIPSPSAPVYGNPWALSVVLRNPIWDGVEFGRLTYDGGFIPLTGPSVNGYDVSFNNVYSVASYSAADEHLYQGVLDGPGGTRAYCSLNTAGTVDWVEPIDAGFHVAPQVSGAPGDEGKTLDTIRGEIESNGDVDTYCIEIVDPATFRATTSSLVDAEATASFDTRLFLLASGDAALAANDDAAGGDLQSEISLQVGVSNGTTNTPVIPSGYALLAITSFPTEPLDDTFSPVFNFAGAFTTLHGPGVANEKVVDWNINSGSGTYTIAFEGTRACTTASLFQDGFESGDLVRWQ